MPAAKPKLIGLTDGSIPLDKALTEDDILPCDPFERLRQAVETEVDTLLARSDIPKARRQQEKRNVMQLFDKYRNETAERKGKGGKAKAEEERKRKLARMNAPPSNPHAKLNEYQIEEQELLNDVVHEWAAWHWNHPDDDAETAKAGVVKKLLALNPKRPMFKRKLEGLLSDLYDEGLVTHWPEFLPPNAPAHPAGEGAVIVERIVLPRHAKAERKPLSALPPIKPRKAR
jgi:hypothetical protein